MTNITKNLLLALTLVCTIALIVFLVQLIVLNRGVEPREPEASIAGGAQQEDPDSGANGDGSEDGENGDGTDENDPALMTPRPPPQGARHELSVEENTTLIIYAKEELFEFSRDVLEDWWFTYTGAGTATLEISLKLVSPQRIAADVVSLLKNYIPDDTPSEFGGEQSIQGSPVMGFHVLARHGGRIYEAWLHDMQSDIALVFIINYENDQQRDALYELLSTLDMA